MSNPADPENRPFTQELQFSNISARVPEKVARGVFATGVLVLQGGMEFVLDFVLRMNQPHQIVARVILPIPLVPQIIDTLKASLEKYRQHHGGAAGAAGAPGAAGVLSTAAFAAPAPPPPAAPTGGTAPPPVNIDEVYQDLKMSDDVLGGVYANALLIVHTASDFCLEFIVKVYPRPVITARVFLSAPQVPILLGSITQAWQTFQTKRQHQQPPPPHPNP
jgi:hypothetical protein